MFQPTEGLLLLVTVKVEVSLWLHPISSIVLGRPHVYFFSITQHLLIDSSLDIILCLLRDVQTCVKDRLSKILFSVHHIDVMGKFEVLVIGELR